MRLTFLDLDFVGVDDSYSRHGHALPRCQARMTDRDAAAPEGVGVTDLPEVSMRTVTEPTIGSQLLTARRRAWIAALLGRRAAGRRAGGARRRRVRGGA